VDEDVAAVSVTTQGYPAAVDLSVAWSTLGMTPTDAPGEVRRRYLERLVEVHPDRSDAPDANEATIRLTEAYRVVLRHLEVSAAGASAGAPPAPHDGDGAAGGGGGGGPTTEGRPVVAIAMVDIDTIAIAAPAGETFLLLLEAGHELGEVDHVDPSAHMLSVVVEFVEGPICQLLCTLQGRATGVTEIFCHIESFDATPPPPIDAVTALVMETMVAITRR